ncbi:MAG: protein TolR [Nitrospirae bacterium CG_4_9_14_3_um_filter_53_35]|nr:MAG: protein TolR [Nitrospirae bacterium CG2_30_53_67]PIS37935.1 MAG: protein TolR [Nitrospirae bacterium CG08_land_8_20_14_0_20_52_24]PIV83349.1 MAG: protein TolR [Nitrospirae bacterium CG17_big_fil_post_rev_8_21_14_2_50_50_9]PIW84210.1 MAG: protein TolR [Nitrospirae bacterium CG_4_8_14_3_um_filter_50_41]PIX85212.1 MAG: protein TolR [Nitrospirae bacterium CG_4_10_14_3_um_filter_53_41]PJA72881.1 MAG: protein TolR [Nitrospirae bacterium CG_4_9_14_3_um_filter_53_35]
MGPTGKNNEYGSMSEINVTPLVDVMLVLLIIFMVTAPMLQQGIDVDLPKTKTSPIKIEEERLVVTVTQSKNIYINKTPFTFEELQKKLIKILEADPHKEVFLRADKNVPYGFVVKVMAAIKEAGIQKLGMVTDVSEIAD